MYIPSLTTLVSVAFLCYMANSMWNIAQLYLPPSCKSTDKICFSSLVEPDTELSLILFTTTKQRPSMSGDLKYLDTLNIHVNEEQVSTIPVKIPKSVTKNGTLFLSIFAVPKLGPVNLTDKNWWQKEVNHPHTTYSLTRLTQYSIPEAETFNLLGEDSGVAGKATVDRSRPVSHLRSKIVVSIMADQVSMSSTQVPGELAHYIQLTKDRTKYLPILYVDELTMRLRDLRMVNATDTSSEVEFTYKPISFGKLRLFLQFSGALRSMHGLGFTEKDTDEVKGIFADTSLVLLLVTFGVSAVHLLFDFLAFKNDISFWRSKRTMEGLSRKTILWRAFSQSVIFFYLLDEETSLLVLIPGMIKKGIFV
jgi:hypothetical protein